MLFRSVFQTLAPAYASEVCPVQLRGYLTTYGEFRSAPLLWSTSLRRLRLQSSTVNLCWVMGQLLASGVLRALLDRQDDWAYRIPFALQWVGLFPLPCPLRALLTSACRSGPFRSPLAASSLPSRLVSRPSQLAPSLSLTIRAGWLVRHGKQAEARNTLLRLTRAKAGDKNFNVDATLAMCVPFARLPPPLALTHLGQGSPTRTSSKSRLLLEPVTLTASRALIEDGPRSLAQRG